MVDPFHKAMRLTYSLLIAVFVMALYKSVLAAGGGAELLSCWPSSSVTSNIFITFPPPYDLKLGRFKCFPSQSRIEYGFGSTNDEVYSVDVMLPEYGFDVWATDASGVIVEMTRVGAKFGTKLTEVSGYDRKKLAKTGGRRRFRPYAMVASSNPAIQLFLPSPAELFKFPKPGQYHVYVRAQAWVYPFKGSRTNAFLARFSPVKLDIVHEP